MIYNFQRTPSVGPTPSPPPTPSVEPAPVSDKTATVVREPTCSLSCVLKELYPSIAIPLIATSIVPAALDRMGAMAAVLARQICQIALCEDQVPVSVACCILLHMREVPFEERLKNAWAFFHKHAITNRYAAQMIATITE